MPENAPGAGGVSAHLARWATRLAVLAVAVIAAVVSYSHIESLALANGYSPSTGRLLPFSVDGLILAASMALATGTRTALARFALVLGIVATVAANAVYGAGHGPVGVVVNMWPAVAFLVSSDLLVGMLRTRPASVAETVSETVTSTPVAGDTGWTVAATGTSQDVTSVVSLEAVPGIAVNPERASTLPTAREKVARTVATTPGPRRAPGRKPDPAKVFAAELAAGQLPSLRAVKERMHVGTPKAREILAELSELASVPVAA